MLQKKSVINNQLINYYQSDNLQKNCLVFLHGWSSEAKHLQIIFENFDNYIAIDLPGFGNSPFPVAALNTKDYAELLQAFLRKLSIEQPIVVGHSLGASIIIKYLADGGQAQKAILISSAGLRNTGVKICIYKVLAKISKLFLLFLSKNLQNTIKKKVYKLIDSEDYLNADNMLETYKKVIRDDLRSEMTKINTPTVIIWGRNDQTTPLSNGQEINRLIPDSKLIVIENAGHFPFIDNKEEFNNIFKTQAHAD